MFSITSVAKMFHAREEKKNGKLDDDCLGVEMKSWLSSCGTLELQSVLIYDTLV